MLRLLVVAALITGSASVILGGPIVGYVDNNGTFTLLNDPLATFGTFAQGINDLGQVVGYYFGRQDGFLYSGGVFTTIDLPGAFQTSLNGINNAGQIVGDWNPAAQNHGFLYSSGTFTTILPNEFDSSAAGINNAGQIVGSYLDTSSGQHGFLYSGGVFTNIADPLGTRGTSPSGINDAGQIVGSYDDSAGHPHGFLYSGGTFTTIDDPLGTYGTAASGINDAGQIVGSYSSLPPGPSGAFIYSGGTFTTIDVPGLPTGATETANGINNLGEITGTAVVPEPSTFLLALPWFLEIALQSMRRLRR